MRRKAVSSTIPLTTHLIDYAKTYTQIQDAEGSRPRTHRGRESKHQGVEAGERRDYTPRGVVVYILTLEGWHTHLQISSQPPDTQDTRYLHI